MQCSNHHLRTEPSLDSPDRAAQVAIGTSSVLGTVAIDTANLDGETSLKLKKAVMPVPESSTFGIEEDRQPEDSARARFETLSGLNT